MTLTSHPDNFLESGKRKEHGCPTATIRVVHHFCFFVPAAELKIIRHDLKTVSKCRSITDQYRDELHSRFEKTVQSGTAVESFSSSLFAAGLEISAIARQLAIVSVPMVVLRYVLRPCSPQGRGGYKLQAPAHDYLSSWLAG